MRHCLYITYLLKSENGNTEILSSTIKGMLLSFQSNPVNRNYHR
jgi:hypothetical protein